MSAVSLRFYAELNDFLPLPRRQVAFSVVLERAASVKDLIESLGVPHTEVDLILANGQSVDFSYRVQAGDHLSIYPVFRTLDVAPLTRVRPLPPSEPRFLLDTHLGKLALYLRMLGFDTIYRNDFGDQELAEISAREQRILLTRDRGLLKRSLVTHGYLVREDDPDRQLAEVVRRFDLAPSAEPFGRCLRCNGRLESVAKAAIEHRLEPKTRRYYHEFRACQSCDRLYWRGSHHDDMLRRVERVLGKLRPE